MIERHADPEAPLPTVLEPLAAMFGVRAEIFAGAARVNDASGATVAVAMLLPAGRERPCEIITPPLSFDHARALERLLAPARELGFTIPQEAAVHLHVDGAPFRRPVAFANLVRLFGYWREVLWAVLDTNVACRRLAALPEPLVDFVEGSLPDAGDGTGWAQLQEVARSAGVTKYSDVNLTQLLTDQPVRDTVEVRILPGDIDGLAIVQRAAIVEALLRRCLDPDPVPRPGDSALQDPRAALDDLVGVRR
jgi:hypothetical protein